MKTTETSIQMGDAEVEKIVKWVAQTDEELQLEAALLDIARREMIARGFLKTLRAERKGIEEELLKLMNEQNLPLLQMMIGMEDSGDE